MGRFAILLLSLALPASAALAQATGAVTIYRCVDAKGHVTLGDTPCARGSTEQVRTMQRPQDAPATASTTMPVPPTPTKVPTPAPLQVIVVRTPQPMYECITPDGERYTSETGDGNPRWVPLWTLGYRSRWRGGSVPSTNVATDRLNDYVQDRPLGGYVGASAASPPAPASGGRPPPSRPSRPGIGAAPGTWIRDTCHALPPSEVCARLVDRRDEIRRRFFNAQETERNTLRREERGINARLTADCG